MAAFQQRRREQHRPPQDLDRSTASDDWAQLGAPSADDDEHPILLFNPPPPAIDSSQWSVVDPPRLRPARSTSYTSSAASTDASGDGAPDSSSLGSPFPLAQASLLPAHDGSGVFGSTAISTRRPLDAGSLLQSDILLPSVYADVDDSAAASDDAASSTFSRVPPSLLRRDSHASSTFSSFAGSDMSRASSSWALTEEALSTLPTTAAAAVRGRQAERGRGRGARDAELADDEDGASAGATSGSEEDEGHARDVGAQRRPTRQAAAARAAAAQKQDDDDWAHSHLAMSAGILPPSSRRRRPPPTTHSALGRSHLVGIGVAPISPDIVSSALRSLSPVSSSARSRNSSGYKRRHRRPGPGARDGETKKRSSAGFAVPVYGEYMERVMREEEERARRMQELLRVRKEEEEVRLAQERVLFGSAVRAYMSIDPSTLALLASATPTASANPTPTPSRAASPTRHAHGSAAFAHQAARELRHSSFDAAASDRADEVSDAETEVDAEHAHSSTVSSSSDGRARARADSQARRWTTYSVEVPPAASLRASSAPDTRLSHAHRSHSTSDLVQHASHDSAPSALGLVLRTPSSSPQRRSSSSSDPSAALDVAARRTRSHAAQALSEAELTRLSHEERILLAPSSSAVRAHGHGHGHDAATAWGGELDSFALALGYWKRLLRRLKEGAGLGPHEGGAAGAGAGGEGAGEAVHLVGGEGGVVRMVAAH
ncbi:hypothetical protein JCM9279_002547 [Rhodotorula babjevae]